MEKSKKLHICAAIMTVFILPVFSNIAFANSLGGSLVVAAQNQAYSQVELKVLGKNNNVCKSVTATRGGGTVDIPRVESSTCAPENSNGSYLFSMVGNKISGGSKSLKYRVTPEPNKTHCDILVNFTAQSGESASIYSSECTHTYIP
jgi:hypothetical protein